MTTAFLTTMQRVLVRISSEQRAPLAARTVLEYAVVAAVTLTADPSWTSLWLGLVVSAAGQAIRLVSVFQPRRWQSVAWPFPVWFLRTPYGFGSLLWLSGLCLAGRSAWVMGAMLIALALCEIAGAHDPRLPHLRSREVFLAVFTAGFYAWLYGFFRVLARGTWHWGGVAFICLFFILRVIYYYQTNKDRWQSKV